MSHGVMRSGFCVLLLEPLILFCTRRLLPHRGTLQYAQPKKHEVQRIAHARPDVRLSAHGLMRLHPQLRIDPDVNAILLDPLPRRIIGAATPEII